MTDHEVLIDYTNWNGFRSLRRIIPKRLWFGMNEWHNEPQWLLDAFDIDKMSERTFAMKDIKDWEPGLPPNA